MDSYYWAARILAPMARVVPECLEQPFYKAIDWLHYRSDKLAASRQINVWAQIIDDDA
jgi:hypothetical protein